MSVFGSKGKKSDDKILEEAEKARLEERMGKVAPEDQLEHTFEEVKDAPVKAAMKGASDERVAALEKQVEDLRRILGESMKVKPASQAQQEVIKREALKRSQIPKCPHCDQYVSVCGGVQANHTTIRVLPERAEHIPNFPGVTWNGVQYCGAAVVVPSVCAQDILARVKRYSEYRFNLNRNRGRDVGVGNRKYVAEALPSGSLPIM